ncbi:hypothetical protein B0T26DRAFT_209007 [Lasiosphaeria miniovina]|uniref:Uncharacterized protein n=1 Tax=Lasiosphaeria miniovina TaxID=1954250 RepID=A0AA40AUF8_9PEZI|nr:uncharacterized protein B0T26DRAFT_209007 [Lasiosphaeria miniovina]KAK0722230.1 hypothetical protein B0T26DRAFT_209007 [Lasiosphaeria miniovina]
MMNRSGAVPQSLRGIPGGFGGQQPQQQPQQSGRPVANRLTNGKLAPVNSVSGWSFGAGVPMGGGGGGSVPPGSARQLGGNISFAQSLSGSQPSTPLDLSHQGYLPLRRLAALSLC